LTPRGAAGKLVASRPDIFYNDTSTRELDMNRARRRFLAIAVMTIAWSTGCTTLDPPSTPLEEPVQQASVVQQETEGAADLGGDATNECTEGSVDCCGFGWCIAFEICQQTMCEN
jgi:hypothetical protein